MPLVEEAVQKAEELTVIEEPTTVQEPEVEKTEETQTTVTEKEIEKVKDEVDPDDVEKDGDGNFVFKVDPSDPKSTIYKGKTRKELFEHIAKGVKDKDIYIKDLKAKSISEEVRRKPAEDDEKVLAPDYSKILDSTLTQLGIEKAMVSWNKEQWREYEAENGAVYTLKMMNLIDGAQAMAKEQVDKDSVLYMNDIMLKDETEQVIELVKEADVEFTKEDYRAILDSIEKDKSSYRENGIRRQGLIVRRCSAKIRELSKDKTVEEVEKKKSVESAVNREKKAEVTTVGKTKGKVEIKIASPKDMDEAYEQIKKEWLK